MLKVDFHLHTNYLQKKETDYSPKELIDRAVELGFDALCITEHYWPYLGYEEYKQDPLKTYHDFKDYAEEKGILLIPAVEYLFPEGDVLLINFTGDITKINELDDLRDLPSDVLKIAPHPFYGSSICLGDDLIRNIKLFDGIEHSFFYYWLFNPNNRAIEVAKEFNLPLIGNSDLHSFKWFGYTYSLVDAEKNIPSIINAVKEGKVDIITMPLPLNTFFYAAYFHTLKTPGKMLANLQKEIKLRILKSP